MFAYLPNAIIINFHIISQNRGGASLTLFGVGTNHSYWVLLTYKTERSGLTTHEFQVEPPYIIIRLSDSL